jgi:aminoglycoside phosphotransferase (APT) family kinase protein
VRRELLNIRQLIARLEQPIFDPVYEWLHARYESVPCHHPAITHRDFTPWNVLLTSQDWRSYAAYVIDWNWQISDPRYDLAWTLTTLDRGGHTQLRADILSEYERQTEGAVEQLAFYEVLVSLRWVLNVRAALHANNPADDVRMLLLPSVKQALTLIQQHTDIMLPDASAVVMG